MALTIKGFVTAEFLINNNTGVIAEVGELSTHSRTFSKEKTYHSNALYPGIDLTVFSSKNDGTPQSMSTVVAEEILKAVEAFKTFDSTGDFVTQYAAALPLHASPAAGARILQNGFHMPEWFSFVFTLPTTTAEVKIWLSDTKFRAEYDEYEIIIIPPASPVTGLYAPYADARSAASSSSFISRIGEIETIRANNPYTSMRAINLRWVDPSDLSLTFQSEWTIVGFGPQATRQSNILIAIRAYLLANSEYSIDQWRQYLPEVKSVETFVFIPAWDKISLSAGPAGDSLYSPVIAPDAITSMVSQYLPSVPYTDNKAYVDYFALLYKSLGIICVGSATNTAGQQAFREKYRDYTVISFNDQNINRLQATTVAGMQVLELLVRQCEADNGTNAVPSGYTRVIEGPFTYLETIEAGVVFRMVTRKSYNDNLVS